jgi:hypothetical protein
MLSALPSQEDGVHAIGVARVCCTVDSYGVPLAALIVASNSAVVRRVVNRLRCSLPGRRLRCQVTSGCRAIAAR